MWVASRTFLSSNSKVRSCWIPELRLLSSRASGLRGGNPYLCKDFRGPGGSRMTSSLGGGVLTPDRGVVVKNAAERSRNGGRVIRRGNCNLWEYRNWQRRHIANDERPLGGGGIGPNLIATLAAKRRASLSFFLFYSEWWDAAS